MAVYWTLEEAARELFNPNRVKSEAEITALLSPEDRARMLEGVDMEKYLYDWKKWGRPKQIIPDFPYFNTHLLLTGRGFGKTRAMCEWVRSKAMAKPNTRIALMGRTNGETRDVLVLGESGLLSIPQPKDDIPEYRKSEGRLIWPNGSEAKILSAETPDAVRGAQFNYSVVDEFAAHTPYVGADGLTAFDNLRLATRLGDYPMLVVATTPKRVTALRKLVDEAEDPTKSIRVVKGRTSENTANLPASYLGVIAGQFSNADVRRQELEGEMLDEDPEGVLWHEGSFIYPKEGLAADFGKKLPLRVVAVDPSVAEQPNDECGIVVVGATNERLIHKRRAYVLDDASLKASPEVWAKVVVDKVHEWNALGAVVEKNQGHHLLTMAIHAIDPTVKVFPVNSVRSKGDRALPVSQMYGQKRVKHMVEFALLQDQMTTWEPGVTKKSPDRVDALVHGITALLINPPEGLVRRGLRSKPPSGRLPEGFGRGFARKPE